jgi:hypothetical protein
MFNWLSSMPWRNKGEWRYNSTILALCNKWRWGISFTPRPLYPRGNFPRYSMNGRLGGPQNRSGPHGEEKILPLSGTKPWTSNVCPIAIPTELSRLKQLNMPLQNIQAVIWCIGTFHRKQQLWVNHWKCEEEKKDGNLIFSDTIWWRTLIQWSTNIWKACLNSNLMSTCRKLEIFGNFKYGKNDDYHLLGDDTVWLL